MTTRNRLLAGAVTALGLVAAVGVVAYRNTLHLIATEHWTAHAHEVLATVDAAVDEVKDAEIALRGYLITADDELARRRAVVHPAVSRTLARLAALVGDDPEQQPNVAAVDAAIRATLAYGDDLLRRRGTRPIGPAELDARLDESLRRMDEIRGLAAQVEHVARRSLDARERAAHAGTRQALAALGGGIVLGLGVLVAVLALLDREARQRRAAEADLLASQRRLELALEASQMGLWDLDLVNDVSHRTLRHDQIFGYETLQPAWGREVFLPHLHPDDRAIEERAFTAAFATGNFAMEVRIIRHGDGALRWIATRGKLFRDARGEPTRLMGSVMDVTERKLAEERLRERSQQLEAANEALGSFTYSVSHDLRAPLRAIHGYARMLEHDHGATWTDESRRLLDVIRVNARQMGRLIDDLLQLSRAGRGRLERAPVEVAALARSVVDELRRGEPERDVTVTLGPLPTARADATMLRQVLANVIGNAWKFTRRRADAAIEIGSTTWDGETVYFVRDNGAGFDMRHAGKLFGVFERLHRGDEFEGTGVGLAIVQRVLQRHGGRVWAEAAVGRGATFYFTVPEGRAAASTPASSSSAGSSTTIVVP